MSVPVIGLTDGEIYYNIRKAHFSRSHDLEMQWWASLSRRNAARLRALIRHQKLATAFDDLMDIPGLRDGMMTSALHKMLALKCDEEILCYLGYIRQVWDQILEGDIKKVDQPTVKALQLTAPRLSVIDATALRVRVLNGEIFSAFNYQQRKRIWVRVMLIDDLIPSLATFFKDLPYLQVWADCMKRWVSPSLGETVSGVMMEHFTGAHQKVGQVLEQVTETTLVPRPGSLEECRDLGRRQLFAYVIRHLDKMPREPGKYRLVRPVAKADKSVLRGFTDLADGLGFTFPDVSVYLRHMSTSDEAESYAPPAVRGILGKECKKRCGLPSPQTYKIDREFFFTQNLHEERQGGEGITSFFVLRSKYFAFFGGQTTRGANVSADLEDMAAQDSDVSVFFLSEGESTMDLDSVIKDEDEGSDEEWDEWSLLEDQDRLEAGREQEGQIQLQLLQEHELQD